MTGPHSATSGPGTPTLRTNTTSTVHQTGGLPEDSHPSTRGVGTAVEEEEGGGVRVGTKADHRTEPRPVVHSSTGASLPGSRPSQTGLPTYRPGPPSDPDPPGHLSSGLRCSRTPVGRGRDPQEESLLPSSDVRDLPCCPTPAGLEGPTHRPRPLRETRYPWTEGRLSGRTGPRGSRHDHRTPTLEPKDPRRPRTRNTPGFHQRGGPSPDTPGSTPVEGQSRAPCHPVNGDAVPSGDGRGHPTATSARGTQRTTERIQTNLRRRQTGVRTQGPDYRCLDCEPQTQGLNVWDPRRMRRRGADDTKVSTALRRAPVPPHFLPLGLYGNNLHKKNFVVINR